MTGYDLQSLISAALTLYPYCVFRIRGSGHAFTAIGVFQAKRVKSSRAAADSAGPPAMNRGQGTVRSHWLPPPAPRLPGPTPCFDHPVTRDEGLFQVVLGGSSAALFQVCLTRRLISSRSLPHLLSLLAFFYSSCPLFFFFFKAPSRFVSPSGPSPVPSHRPPCQSSVAQPSGVRTF